MLQQYINYLKYYRNIYLEMQYIIPLYSVNTCNAFYAKN